MKFFNKIVPGSAFRYGMAALFAICFLNSFISLSNNALYYSSSTEHSNDLSFNKSNVGHGLISDVDYTFENEDNEDENDENDKQELQDLFLFLEDYLVLFSTGELSNKKLHVFDNCNDYRLSIVPRYILFHSWKFHLS